MGGILFHIPDSGYDWGSFTGDDFTGINGDPLSTTIWTDQASTDEWLIQNNKANVDQEASEEALSDSTFSLSGDFDVQIDFDSLVATDETVLRMQTHNAAWTYGTLVGVQKISGVKNFHGRFKTVNTWGPQTTVPRTNTYGKIRTTRVGTVLTHYYRDGVAGWIEIVHKDQLNSDDMFITLHAKTVVGGSQSGNFDNFVINSGTVVAP